MPGVRGGGELEGGQSRQKDFQELRCADAAFTSNLELFLSGAWKDCWWSCGCCAGRCGLQVWQLVPQPRREEGS